MQCLLQLCSLCRPSVPTVLRAFETSSQEGRSVLPCPVALLRQWALLVWVGEVGVKTKETKTPRMKNDISKTTVSTKLSQELSKNSCKGLTKCLAYSNGELLWSSGIIHIIAKINYKLRPVRPQDQESTLTVFRELKQISLISCDTRGGNQPVCFIFIQNFG